MAVKPNNILTSVGEGVHPKFISGGSVTVGRHVALAMRKERGGTVNLHHLFQINTSINFPENKRTMISFDQLLANIKAQINTLEQVSVGTYENLAKNASDAEVAAAQAAKDLVEKLKNLISKFETDVQNAFTSVQQEVNKASDTIQQDVENIKEANQ